MAFSPDPSLSSRLARLCGLFLAAGLLAGCDRIKARLYPEQTDPVWSGDSSMLASEPDLLFRIGKAQGVERIVPMATMGKNGFRMLSFGNRGWRALDAQFLTRGATLEAVRDGRSVGVVKIARGMWDAAGVLDSMPNCPIPVPAGIPESESDVRLMTTRKRPPLKPVTPLSDAALQQALEQVATLVAPTSGINGATLARYRREVHVAATGATSSPSIVILFEDPEVVADSVLSVGQRPRQLVVVLDKGVYGYRPTYTFTTLGNGSTSPRLEYLDYVDVDSDGQAELFFGIRHKDFPFAMSVLRFQSDAWRELVRLSGERCRS